MSPQFLNPFFNPELDFLTIFYYVHERLFLAANKKSLRMKSEEEMQAEKPQS